MFDFHVASRISNGRIVCRNCEGEAIRRAQEDTGGIIGFTELLKSDIKKMEKRLKREGKDPKIICSICGRRIK